MDNSIKELFQKNNAEIIERIKYLISISRLTQAKFAQRISMDPANLSKILSGTLKISDSFLNRLVVELNVSKKWVLTGEGVPFDKSPEKLIDRISDSIILQSTKAKGIPVYDIDVTAGFNEFAGMLTKENIIGFMDFPKLDSQSVMVRVSGDSMTPIIEPGAFIAIHSVQPGGIISWGQIYVIILEEYRMVKYIRRHSDNDKVILHSANPNYDDIEINKKDIIALYMVDAIVNCKIL